MKRFCVVWLIFLIAATASGQTSKRAQSAAKRVEGELRALEDARRLAIKNGDEKTLNAIYADDFSAITGAGTVIDKQQLMAVFRRNDASISFTTDEISVRYFGSTAVFTGRLTGRTGAGEIVSMSRFSHLFVKRHGKWQCVAGQSTPIARPN
jgi:ketosteroid isomerase-like protein